MSTKTQHTFETIMIYPIGTKVIVTEATHKARERGDLTQDEEFGIIVGLGIVKQPKMAIIDNEAVGNKLSSEDDEFEINLYVHNPVEQIFEAGSRFSIGFTIAKISDHLDEPIALKAFMKDNYQRKSRLVDNERAWLKYFNS